jgi:ElaB/YqjD/DUF883 family membrane-anchored ribosome-binding protein
MAAANEKAEDAPVQIARLRQQVKALTEDRITPVVAKFADQASSAITIATEAISNQAQTVSDQVRERPLMAIMIAAAVGWLIGRVLR